MIVKTFGLFGFICLQLAQKWPAHGRPGRNGQLMVAQGAMASSRSATIPYPIGGGPKNSPIFSPRRASLFVHLHAKEGRGAAVRGGLVCANGQKSGTMAHSKQNRRAGPDIQPSRQNTSKDRAWGPGWGVGLGGRLVGIGQNKTGLYCAGLGRSAHSGRKLHLSWAWGLSLSRRRFGLFLGLAVGEML